MNMLLPLTEKILLYQTLDFSQNFILTFPAQPDREEELELVKVLETFTFSLPLVYLQSSSSFDLQILITCS